MPRGWAVKPIQRLKAGIAWPWARNNVPTSSPATILARLPGVRPLAMITFSPAVVAMRAASSLLAMPPLLMPVTLSRTRLKIDGSSRVTVGISFEFGSRGSPSYSPSTSESSTSSGRESNW